jgi:ferredoxin--NADP+ reductase
MKIAIVGSGPAGFYAAGQLLNGADVSIDMIDRLPTPWGLVRAGVAPDHPKIKTVTRVFEKIAANPRFRFFGGVEFGRDVTRSELAERYHAIVYATGTSADRPLGIPGGELSRPATAFVGWYNGHPDFPDEQFDLTHERAVVIGNGNVALDVARMLVLPDEHLRVTDTADHAIEAFARSSVREVVVVGRRGAEQAAFTNPELRELGDVCDVVVDADELSGEGRNVDVLREYAARPLTGRRRIVLRFLRSPVELTDDSVKLVRNELVDGRAVPTGSFETVQAGLVLHAIGYRGVQLPDVPFDEARGTIANEGGRVALGEYAVGWIKRGPSGVIGTNKKCAQDTVNRLLEDIEAGRLLDPDPSAEELPALTGAVTYDGWKRIDEHEQWRGKPVGRPRVKLTRVREMVSIAGGD